MIEPSQSRMSTALKFELSTLRRVARASFDPGVPGAKATEKPATGLELLVPSVSLADGAFATCSPSAHAKGTTIPTTIRLGNSRRIGIVLQL